MITLKEIRNWFIDHTQNESIRAFVGAMICDRGILQSQKKLFYNEIEKQTWDIFRVIDESYFKKYKPTELKRIQFEPDRGVIKEFFDNKAFTLDLPIVEGKDITKPFIQHFLWALAKHRIIDDLLYTIINNIVSTLGVNYDHETKRVGFGSGQRSTKIKSGKVFTNIKVKDISLEEVLNSEILQGYVNKDIGDPNREYAYAHLLRAHASFILFGWAKKIFINWKRYNIVAASRGNGKTMLAAMVAVRELLKPWKWFGWRNYRAIKYFVPDKANIGDEAMQYMESLLGDLLHKKVNGKPIFELQRSKFTIKCNLTGNVLKLISLHNLNNTSGPLGTSIGEGLACDVAIIDESCRIINDFWTSFHQRAAFETDTFFIISTINEETPVDHWFYRMLIDWETWAEDIASYRITIDENEVMQQGKTKEQYEKEKEIIKKEYRLKWDKEFYSKGYCIILEESNVFNTGTYIVPAMSSKYNDSDPRILGFDLGKLTDTCGLVLINLKHREIEEAKKVINATYGTQLLYAEDYKKRYPNLLVIGDRSGVGESVSEQDVKNVVDTWIKSTGQGELSYNRKYRYYTCNKGMIINTFSTVMNTNLLKIPADQTDLVDQMNSFIKMKSGRGEVVLYTGKGRAKDDLVLSGAYAIVYMYLILGLKSIKDIEDYVNEIWNSMTYSYNDHEDTESSWGYHQGLY